MCLSRSKSVESCSSDRRETAFKELDEGVQLHLKPHSHERLQLHLKSHSHERLNCVHIIISHEIEQ